MAAGPILENLADGRKWSGLGITFIWENSAAHDLHAMPTFDASTGSNVTFM